MLHPVRGVLCVEGVQTGDGRLVQMGALTWVDPPLPLAWIVEGDQHIDLITEAPQVGTIQIIQRVGNEVTFTGTIDDEIEDAAEAVRRMQAGSAPLGNRFGLSIDPDDWEMELVNTDPDDDEDMLVIMAAAGVGRFPPRLLVAAAGEGDPGGEVLMEDSADSLIQRYTRLRIRGATMCSVAAFDGAYVELVNVSAAVGDSGASPEATAETDEFAAAHGPFNGIHSHPHAAFGSQGDDGTHEHTHNHHDDAHHDHDHTVTASADCEDCDQGLTAAGGPLLPPAEWFQNPNFRVGDGRLVRQPSGDYACPLTVTADGHVFGHMAGWHSCHTGFVDRCVTPPRSPSGYAFFNDGPLPTAEGETVHVGQLTMGAGHPEENQRRPLNWKAAKAHYDGGPGAVQMADVCVGEDQFGIWFSGALRPEVTDEQVRAFRACAVSGDWREVVRGKGLDLIACAAGVVSEGFQIARLAASADADVAGRVPSQPLAHFSEGRLVALVASGVVRQPLPWERALAAQQEQIDQLASRLNAAENVTNALRPIAAEHWLEAAGVPANGSEKGRLAR